MPVTNQVLSSDDSARSEPGRGLSPSEVPTTAVTIETISRSLLVRARHSETPTLAHPCVVNSQRAVWRCGLLTACSRGVVDCHPLSTPKSPLGRMFKCWREHFHLRHKRMIKCYLPRVRGFANATGFVAHLASWWKHGYLFHLVSFKALLLAEMKD